MHPPRNPYLCILIVGTFGVVTLVGLVGMIALSFAGKELPQSATMLVGTAIGSLGTFLVTPPRGSVGIGNDPHPPPKQ